MSPFSKPRARRMSATFALLRRARLLLSRRNLRGFSHGMGACGRRREIHADVSSRTSSSPVVAFSASVLIGMAGVELANTARLCISATDTRPSPVGIVSQGIWSTWAFIRPPKTHGTDIAPALIAARRAWVGESDIYGELNLNLGPAGFIYPPTAVVLLMPFGWLCNQFGEATATRVIDLTWRICALATVWIASRFVEARRRREMLLIAFVFLAFYPVRWMLMCVQAQSLITLLLVGSIVAYSRSREGLSGVLMGLAITLKPHFSVLLLFGTIRRRWRFTGGSATSVSILIAVSLIVPGVSTWRDYVTKVLPPLTAGYGYYPNQSVNGIVHRWLGDTTDFKLAPSSAATRMAAIIAIVVFGGLAVWPRLRGGSQDGQCQIVAADDRGVVSRRAQTT